MEDRHDPDTSSDPSLSSWASPCLRVSEDNQAVFCLCVRVHPVTKSLLTLCTPMVCSSSGASVHGISQARIWERVAISSLGILPTHGLNLCLLHRQVASSPVHQLRSHVFCLRSRNLFSAAYNQRSLVTPTLYCGGAHPLP